MRGPFRWLESALSQPCASRRTRHLPARGLTGGNVDASPRLQRLAGAVALSAAAVHSPAAGSFDPDAYRRPRGEVVTQVLPETADRPGATSA